MKQVTFANRVLAAVTSFACSGCMSPSLRASVNEFEAELATVNVTDGLDAVEAEVIATAYLKEYVSGCGVPEPAELHGKTWIFPLRLGYSGERSNKRIGVDAESGQVQGAGGPLFKTFAEFKKEVVSAYIKRRRHN
jgi:hypothetical protein